ncbi:LutC/YkgG family protein [Paeniglutamicibacter cryotolerans]|uniref:L-lactate dehydrogenase complex protein LldG n=1 Tax=Paeniglutamicibacter cryotolerans TaxID=670079 RepID=A0A839QEY6_9MICC|nr:lactate utilization protein C [Paeniglutamicibacter cryotolerans]MBB2994709.1 L-lactate dehydrogenase complex protein LldG [Paeniglutamicibacter cryotolerans]
MSAREEILARITGALADSPVARPVPRGYLRASDTSTARLIELLTDRLADYKAHVDVVASAGVPGILAGLLAGAESYVVPSGLPDDWFAHPALEADGAPRRLRDDVSCPLSVAELDRASAVITASAVSVAESGTIMLDGSPAQGRRVISLVPDHHVCLVPASSIVHILPEAVARLDGTRAMTWISGPSATSDIELERVEGVHGPRRLDVIIITDK